MDNLLMLDSVTLSQCEIQKSISKVGVQKRKV
jgi:hypothetical protein